MINRERIDNPKPVHRMPLPKPALEMMRLPVFRVHYQSLERYVQRVFGFEFDYLFAANVVEGCAVDYVVNGDIPTVAIDRQAIDLRQGRRTKNVPLILNVLAHDAYIPKGQYTVSTHLPPNPTAVYTQLLRQTLSPLHPDCLAFKSRHTNDADFLSRAAILEQSLMEQLEK